MENICPRGDSDPLGKSGNIYLQTKYLKIEVDFRSFNSIASLISLSVSHVYLILLNFLASPGMKSLCQIKYRHCYIK